MLLRDITEKKVASELIRKSEETMSEAQNIARFGSWECCFNDEGVLEPGSLKLSKELCRILGLNEQGPGADHELFFSFIHPDDREYIKRSMCISFERKTNFESEYRIIREDGEVRWLRSKSKISFTDYGKPYKVVGIAQDITQRKSAEEERSKLINDLLQRNKDLEQFTFIVSHNLRSPLAQILGLVNAFGICESDQEAQLRCMEYVRLASQRLDHVITDLNEILQVKKHESERKAWVSFSELVTEIRETLGTQLNNEKGTINCNFDRAGGLLSLKGYLYSIFYNLVLNSLKYRKQGTSPLIEIRSEREDNKTVICFKDNGIGIDLNANGKDIFGLYRRFTDVAEGKGLGLYMVKMQVEALGGTVTVKSEVNKGTEFRIAFGDKQ
ncbi:MAG TPA: PAS domain-containing sensor histidine kinase [Bacteroidia bacterium]